MTLVCLFQPEEGVAMDNASGFTDSLEMCIDDLHRVCNRTYAMLMTYVIYFHTLTHTDMHCHRAILSVGQCHSALPAVDF